MNDSQDSATQRPPGAGPLGRGKSNLGKSKASQAAVPEILEAPSEQIDATYVEGADIFSSEDGYRVRHQKVQGAGRWVRFVRAGGMGAVVEVAGEDLGDGSGLEAGERRFALKMVKQSLRRRAAVVDRFRRELRSHRKLTVDLMATRLVPCIAVLEAESLISEEGLEDEREERAQGELFGLFPFFPDGSLETCLAEGMSQAEALFVVVDAVEGLQSLHGHRYIHRDFHPSNILVEREGGRRRGMLGDLGVGMFWEANTIFSEERVEEDRGHRVGHPGYIDPYVRASAHADLFAVGVTIFRILTGVVPSSSAGPLRLPPSDDFSPTVRQLADEVLTKLTSPTVEERFASAREARGAVVRLAEQMPVVSSRPVAPSEKKANVSSAVPPARPVVSRMGEDQQQTARERGRHWRRLAATPLAILVFAAVGFGGWRLVESKPVDLPTQGAAIGGQNTLPPESQTTPSESEEAPAAAEKGPEIPSAGDDEPTPNMPVTSKQAATKPATTIPGTVKPGTTTLPKKSSTRNPMASKPAASKPNTGNPGSSQAAVVSRSQEKSSKQATLPSAGGRRPPVPRSHSEPAPDLAEADRALQDGRFDRARRLLEELHLSHPTDPEVTSRLASLFLRDREVGPGMARRILTTAVAAHPKRGDLRLFLARVLHQIGHNEEALNLLSQAPTDSSFAHEIADLRVTLEKASDPQ